MLVDLISCGPVRGWRHANNGQFAARASGGLLAVLCCAAAVGLPHAGQAAEKIPLARSQVTVMSMVQGPGQERSQIFENTLTQAFLRHGYKVIDAATVIQSLRRNAYPLKQAETEAAKRLGSGLGADIVVSGEAKSRVVDKTYTLLEGKKVILSQAEVTLKAVLSRSGRVIVAENASQRKPFDTAGQIALQIGIDDYQQWPKLQYAVNDARSVESLVRGLGFTEVISVLDGDATKQRILRILGDELYAQTHPDDRVFIFFAGHGQTQDLPTGGVEIVPVPILQGHGDRGSV
jgi:hypothetical protein